MGKKITVNQVAKLLNCSPLSIRIGLQRNELPFGTAIKTSSNASWPLRAVNLRSKASHEGS